MIRMSLRGWKYIAAAVLVSGAAFLCTLAAGLYLTGPEQPSFEQVRASHRLSDALLPLLVLPTLWVIVDLPWAAGLEGR